MSRSMGQVPAEAGRARSPRRAAVRSATNNKETFFMPLTSLLARAPFWSTRPLGVKRMTNYLDETKLCFSGI